MCVCVCVCVCVRVCVCVCVESRTLEDSDVEHKEVVRAGLGYKEEQLAKGIHDHPVLRTRLAFL